MSDDTATTTIDNQSEQQQESENVAQDSSDTVAGLIEPNGRTSSTVQQQDSSTTKTMDEPESAESLTKEEESQPSESLTKEEESWPSEPATAKDPEPTESQTIEEEPSKEQPTEQTIVDEPPNVEQVSASATTSEQPPKPLTIQQQQSPNDKKRLLQVVLERNMPPSISVDAIMAMLPENSNNVVSDAIDAFMTYANHHDLYKIFSIFRNMPPPTTTSEQLDNIEHFIEILDALAILDDSEVFKKLKISDPTALKMFRAAASCLKKVLAQEINDSANAVWPKKDDEFMQKWIDCMIEFGEKLRTFETNKASDDQKQHQQRDFENGILAQYMKHKEHAIRPLLADYFKWFISFLVEQEKENETVAVAKKKHDRLRKLIEATSIIDKEAAKELEEIAIALEEASAVEPVIEVLEPLVAEVLTTESQENQKSLPESELQQQKTEFKPEHEPITETQAIQDTEDNNDYDDNQSVVATVETCTNGKCGSLYMEKTPHSQIVVEQPFETEVYNFKEHNESKPTWIDEVEPTSVARKEKESKSDNLLTNGPARSTAEQLPLFEQHEISFMPGRSIMMIDTLQLT